MKYIFLAKIYKNEYFTIIKKKRISHMFSYFRMFENITKYSNFFFVHIPILFFFFIKKNCHCILRLVLRSENYWQMLMRIRIFVSLVKIYSQQLVLNSSPIKHLQSQSVHCTGCSGRHKSTCCHVNFSFLFFFLPSEIH